MSIDRPLATSEGLRLTWRLTQLEDLNQVQSVLADRLLYEDPVRRNDLFSLWRHLMEERACISAVIEDQPIHGRSRCFSFGMSVFVTDEFARQLKAEMPPFISLQVLKLWRSGKRPFLLPEEIQRENAGSGLTVLVLHNGAADSLPSILEKNQVLQMNVESYFAAHCGYRIKEHIQELYSEEQREWVEAGGLEVYRDYKEFRGDPFYGSWMNKIPPCLMGITAQRAMERVGIYAINRLFTKAVPPRFGFLEGEREVLQQALLGQAEAQVAKVLKISPNTVKKRWQGLYQKVEAADSRLFYVPGTSESERLKQRRRLLLDYLRQHPEELRPSH